MWKVPSFSRHMKFNVGHVFSGSFCGWSKAWEWMCQKGLIDAETVFFVDSSPEMAPIWESEHQAECHRFQVPFTPSQGPIGACCDVDEVSWLNMCREDNLLWTASPPCISWSAGGKELGLESAAGIAFLQLAKKARWARPVACFVECTENTPQHSHYRILQFAFRKAGFKCVWSGISDIGPMTKMTRRRWLAVWVRCDVAVSKTVGSF